MTRHALRWDFARREYDDVEIPDGCSLGEADMDALVTCPGCGYRFSYGATYTSRRWHTAGGLGYAVCPECYAQEWREEREAGHGD